MSTTDDGFDYPIDLDPTTPGVNGVYITRMATPQARWGFGLTTVTAYTGAAGSTSFTLTGGGSSSILGQFSQAPSAVFVANDSLGNNCAFTSISSYGGVLASGVQQPLGSTSTARGVYLNPPIKVYANAPWFLNAGFDKVDNVSFPLVMKNGAPIKEQKIGFIVINHGTSSASALSNLTIDIWPKVN